MLEIFFILFIFSVSRSAHKSRDQIYDCFDLKCFSLKFLVFDSYEKLGMAVVGGQWLATQ
jgi:hypothetical protein